MLLNALASESNPKKGRRKKVKTPVKAAEPEPPLPSTPVAARGHYPCVLRSCSVILPVSRMLNHVRSFHSKFYCEVSKVTTLFLFVFITLVCFRDHLIGKERLQ